MMKNASAYFYFAMAFLFFAMAYFYGFLLIFSNPYIQVKKSEIGAEDEDVRGC